ncbi:putative ribonuclease H-like domain-containing protein [Tanacetum coccineum]
MIGLLQQKEMDAVPPPMIGNYMPSRPDVEIDDSKFTIVLTYTQPMNLNHNQVNLILGNQTLWIILISSKNKGNIDRWMFQAQTVNKAYLAEFQDINVALFFMEAVKVISLVKTDEVFAHVARIEAIRIFLAFASYMGFIVYQMDVKSAFLYGNINEEVYVSQPPGFLDPKYPQKVYKVVKALYGLHQAPRAWYATLSTFLLKNGYRRGTIDKTLFKRRDKHGYHTIELANVKTASTPIETQKPLVKDEEASDVDVHLYRSTLKSFPSKCYQEILDSDYAGANLDRKSTTGGCQFLGRRLISWQCKKQTIMATSTTEAEYVAAASCCGQVLWIQNQMLDYGFNFMNTKIYIDNESTICIVKNPVYHSKTKHIAIRHHFIRDAYEKKLIQVLKIHTDDNVADLLTKAFDVSRGLLVFRESLRRVNDGTDALLIPTLFILWLDKVSTDSAKLVPLGKVCTAIETLKKNTAKALISLLTTISLSSKMAVLDSCPKHNMVAYLEKSEGNEEFHEIIDFLKRSSIHHALTVSPVVSTTFVEQFWTSAKSKTINNVRHITAKVAGKSVSISEASVRSDLLFDDVNGIDSLPNQAIFDAIQLMGSKSTSWDQIPTNIATAVICLTSNQKYNFSKLIFDGKQLVNVPVPLDHFLVNTLTSKVFSFMVKKGKHFSVKVTPLFATMWAQPTQDEGASSERPSEAQPTPSPAPTSETDPSPRPSPTTTIPDSIPETSGGNLGGHSSSDKSLSGSRSSRNKLNLSSTTIAWLKSSLKHKLTRKSFPKKQRVLKESVSKQGRKFAKECQDEGRTREIVDEDKEIDEVRLSTEDEVSTVKEGVSTDLEKVSTDRPIVSTDGSKVSTDMHIEGTDEQVKGTEEHNEGTEDKNVGTKEIFEGTEELRKGTEEKVESTDGQVKETDRPRPTSTRSLLTLKPLPKIDPKDKGKKKIEAGDESERKS